jgi:hypothetical protein
MEAIEALDIQERIKLAVSNIETIEKEAISFSKSRKDLQELAKSLAEHIEIQKTQLIEFQQLMKTVKSSLVEDTLVQFEKNVVKTQELMQIFQNNLSANLNKEILEFKDSILKDFKKQSSSSLKILYIIGAVNIVFVLVNVVINLFIQ